MQCLLASVCFRQTSVVWVVFVAGAVVLRTAESAPELKRCESFIPRYLLLYVHLFRRD